MTEKRPDPNAHPEANLVTGHPAQDPAPQTPQDPGTPAPPVEESVMIGGTEYKMSSEAAAATRAQQTEYTEQLQAAYTPAVAPEPEPEQQSEGVNFEDLIYTDPNKAFQVHGEMIVNAVTEAVRNEQNKKDSRQDWWDEFFKANDDIPEDDKFIVSAIMEESWSKVENLPGDKAIEVIGDLTRKRIMGLTKNPDVGKPNNTQTLEGGGSAPQDDSQEEDPKKLEEGEDPNQPKSISEAVRRRNEQRSKSASG